MAKAPKKKALGKGLAALLGEEGVSATISASEAPVSTEGPQSIAIELIKAGKFQPRREFDQDALQDLAESIKANGIIQPILVRKVEETEGLFEIVAGERRRRAAQLAQLHEVPVLVRELDDQRTLEIAIVENIQREDLNPLEEAEGYLRLAEAFSYTQEKISEISGKSRPHIANMMRLVQLPKAVKEMLQDGRLSAGHARALLPAANPEKLAQAVLNLSLNVRQTEVLVKKEGSPSTAKQTETAGKDKKDPNIKQFEKNLEGLLGLKVEVLSKGAKGVVSFHYQNLDQLENIVEKLKK